MTIGPIYDASRVVDDPHVIARGMVGDYPDPEMGRMPMHAVVPPMLGTPGSIRTPAPGLGEHNRSLLAKVGIDDAAFADLVRDRVVWGVASPPPPTS